MIIKSLKLFLTNIKIKKFSIIIFISYSLLNCKNEELKIVSTTLCEYSISDGNCDQILEPKKVYNINFTKENKIETYNQLANFLYFKYRISSGYILKFNRPLLLAEKESFRSTYKVYYNVSNTRGLVDGLDLGNDYVYSFVYIGNLLKEKNREKGDHDKIFPKNLNIQFPITFTYSSTLFSGNVETSQEVHIIKE